MGVHADNETYLEIKKLLDIPEDEPIFILRAQDKYSLDTLAGYVEVVVRNAPDDDDAAEWYNNIRALGNKFMKWRQANVDKVKVPD